MDAALAAAGFDIAHRFDVATVAREPGLALLAAGPERLGILVGNSRALWPKFRAAMPAGDDPLQRYTEAAIEAALPAGARCYFAHRRYDGAFVPFQRLAVAAGLGSLSPTQLVIHPVYGPWFALRAVVVCAGSPPPTAPIAAVCQCGSACQDAMARALAATGPESWRAWLAVRDSCVVGKSWRYDDEQIRYHYLKAFSR